MITQSYIPAPAAIPMHAELNSPAAVEEEENSLPAAEKMPRGVFSIKDTEEAE